MTKIAVILHGSGARDGSEIHEATLTLLALDQQGAKVQCFSPFETQARVINHLTGEVVKEVRWMQVEAARIARGKVSDICQLRAADFDGVIFPGGSGTAVNLCSFASDGAQMQVNPQVERVIREFHAAQKPIGAICIAPVLVAKVLGSHGVRVTLGSNAEEARAVVEMGALSVEAGVGSCVIDRENRVVTTPAYMLAKSIRELWPGINDLCKSVIEMSVKR
jgi:enhancing lycopene biosynthesis protein 2